VCNSVLQCVTVCCSVLQCLEVCYSVLQCVIVCSSVLQCVTVCCSVLQCVAVCCSVLQCYAARVPIPRGRVRVFAYVCGLNISELVAPMRFAVHSSVLQCGLCGAVCWGVLQCVAVFYNVCCSVLHYVSVCRMFR